MRELLEASPYLLGDDDELDITEEVMRIVVNEVKGSSDVVTLAGKSHFLFNLLFLLPGKSNQIFLLTLQV